MHNFWNTRKINLTRWAEASLVTHTHTVTGSKLDTAARIFSKLATAMDAYSYSYVKLATLSGWDDHTRDT
jgi:hypothetical protein